MQGNKKNESGRTPSAQCVLHCVDFLHYSTVSAWLKQSSYCWFLPDWAMVSDEEVTARSRSVSLGRRRNCHFSPRRRRRIMHDDPTPSFSYQLRLTAPKIRSAGERESSCSLFARLVWLIKRPLSSSENDGRAMKKEHFFFLLSAAPSFSRVQLSRRRLLALPPYSMFSVARSSFPYEVRSLCLSNAHAQSESVQVCCRCYVSVFPFSLVTMNEELFSLSLSFTSRLLSAHSIFRRVCYVSWSARYVLLRRVEV